jgi:hypothetical protein
MIFLRCSRNPRKAFQHRLLKKLFRITFRSLECRKDPEAFAIDTNVPLPAQGTPPAAGGRDGARRVSGLDPLWCLPASIGGGNPAGEPPTSLHDGAQEQCPPELGVPASAAQN